MDNIPMTAPQKRLREDNVDEPPAKKTKVVEPDSEIGAEGLGLDSKVGSIAKESFDDLFPSFKHVVKVRKGYDGSRNVIHLVFDVNGTLGSLTKNAVYTDHGKIINYRPHIDKLWKLEKHGFEIGIWSSATSENVSEHTNEIRKHGNLTEPYFCVFDRSFTEPAPEETRTNTWDTIKPLRKIYDAFPKLSHDRLILVEDRVQKFVEDDLKNGILVKPWNEEGKDVELLTLINFLLDMPATDSALEVVSRWNDLKLRT